MAGLGVMDLKKIKNYFWWIFLEIGGREAIGISIEISMEGRDFYRNLYGNSISDA